MYQLVATSGLLSSDSEDTESVSASKGVRTIKTEQGTWWVT